MSAKTQIIHEKRKCIYEQTRSQKEYIFREDRIRAVSGRRIRGTGKYMEISISLRRNMAAESFC